MKFSQPNNARAINRARVLCTLLEQPNISKIELSNIIKVNKVSIGEIVEDLIKDNLIIKKEKRKTSNGRPPTNLIINREYKYIFCISLKKNSFSLALIDINNTLIKFQQLPITGSDELIASIIRFFKQNITSDRLLKSLVISQENSALENKIINALEHFLEIKTYYFNSFDAQINSFLWNYPNHKSTYLLFLEEDIKAAIVSNNMVISKLESLDVNNLDSYFRSSLNLENFTLEYKEKIEGYKRNILNIISKINSYTNINHFCLSGPLSPIFEENENIFININRDKAQILGASAKILDEEIYNKTIINQLFEKKEL